MKGKGGVKLLRTNRKIRAREVRVIGNDGQQLGIMPPQLALQKALDVGLDLVEITPDTKPPVCKIMDYGKYKYEQKKRNNQAKKKATSNTVKEIKFRPKIEEHDYNFKVNKIKKFLSEGHKMKITMMFRGREMAFKGRARDLMLKVAAEVDVYGQIDAQPKQEGRNMFMALSPRKGAPKFDPKEEKAKAEAEAEASAKAAKLLELSKKSKDIDDESVEMTTVIVDGVVIRVPKEEAEKIQQTS